MFRFAVRQQKQARRRGIAPLSLDQAQALLEKFDGRCAYCPRPAATWDHVEPVAKGGLTRLGNVVPACVSCNSSKRARDVEEWAAARRIDLSYEFYEVTIMYGH